MQPPRSPHETSAAPHAGDRDVVLEVWHAAASPSDPGAIEQRCEGWLDDDDRERAARFKHAGARNQHVVGRGMMRHLLSSPTVEPQSIRFGTLPHGRPFVREPREVCRPFNVSHTSGLVLCGIAAAGSSVAVDHQTGDGLVGIDVERLDRRTDIALAERYFSPPEIAFVRSHRSETSQRHAFLQVWTLKEAFIKAIGTGLHTPLADFAFREVDSDSPRIEMLDPGLESGVLWTFLPLQPRPGFVAAVAVGRPVRESRVRLHVGRFEDVVDSLR